MLSWWVFLFFIFMQSLPVVQNKTDPILTNSHKCSTLYILINLITMSLTLFLPKHVSCRCCPIQERYFTVSCRKIRNINFPDFGLSGEYMSSQQYLSGQNSSRMACNVFVADRKSYVSSQQYMSGQNSSEMSCNVFVAERKSFATCLTWCHKSREQVNPKPGKHSMECKVKSSLEWIMWKWILTRSLTIIVHCSLLLWTCADWHVCKWIKC